MTHDPQKSDSSTVAKKPTNEPSVSGAEPVERRGEAKGNTFNPPTRRTQCRGSVLMGLDRVRQAAKARKKERFTALLHHVSVEAMKEAYLSLQRQAAPGVDGTTWEEYAHNLEANLKDLHARVFRGAYRARPSRRVYHPDEGELDCGCRYRQVLRLAQPRLAPAIPGTANRRSAGTPFDPQMVKGRGAGRRQGSP